jgi:hypothetical protein
MMVSRSVRHCKQQGVPPSLSDATFPPALAALFQPVARPGAQARIGKLLARGLQRRSPAELALWKAVAE